MRYSAPLDGLRAIAILVVLIFHMAPAALPGGFIGVDVFYVLSGFLITSILVAGIDRGTEIQGIGTSTSNIRSIQDIVRRHVQYFGDIRTLPDKAAIQLNDTHPAVSVAELIAKDFARHFADGAFGNVRRIQQENFGNRVIASDLANPDFVKFGVSFGAEAERARTPQELREALERAFARRDTPTLIEVPVGSFPSPWPFLQMPPNRGGPAKPHK